MTVKVDLLTLTAAELQALLADHVITSREIVKRYLEQIDRHNDQGLKLRAVISVQRQAELSRLAQQLDDERRHGHVRGPLHGVPIIIKDICTTISMPCTLGSHAFKQARARIDAPLINTLHDAGLIIIAKANLSELGNAKGDQLMAGWSAVGGQCVNPYVRGDIPNNAPFATSWGPAGSSSGSATAVAAGFSPVSLGTELQGSITWPAARVGLYAIKLSPGSVDETGFQPGAPGFDCQGPYGKTVIDVATLSAVIQRREANHYLPLSNSWNGMRVGVVDPTLWRVANDVVEIVDGFWEQSDSALYEAQRRIRQLGAKVVENVPLATFCEIQDAMPDVKYMEDLFTYSMKKSFPDFFALWDGAPQTIEELIHWNNEHADLEFTDRNNNQKALESMRDCTMTQDQYDRNSRALREAAQNAVKAVLNGCGVDVILAPCDSRLNSVASAAGYPLGNLPLGFADFNGRGFSLHAIAPAGAEGDILQVMSAWEATFPHNVRPPGKLRQVAGHDMA